MTGIVVAVALLAVFGLPALFLARQVRKWNAEDQADRDADRHQHYDNYAFVYQHPRSIR